MRIAFADLSGWDYHVGSVATVPIGGSQSAACHLAQALAKQGHDVFFLTHTRVPGVYDRVSCLSWHSTNLAQLGQLECDVFVCLLGAGAGAMFREALGPKTKLILWTQHSFDQDSILALRDSSERDCYDGFAFVSDWQRGEFIERFQIDPRYAGVLRNAPSPSFLDLFAKGAPILPAKASPPILAYTSTPFRGLDLLVEAFPAIRAAIPGVRLRVFSSMRVYQVAPVMDHLQNGALYQRCRSTPGVEYVGSLPQPVLAAEMRSVTMLAYPNIFAETSCIAVMEAMAAGCHVVTSALGALPETTAGFGRLVRIEPDRPSYLRGFVDAVIEGLQEHRSGNGEVEKRLRRQMDYMHEHATWEQRAREWFQWLESLSLRC